MWPGDEARSRYERAKRAHSYYVCMKDTNIYNNPNLCTPKKVAKINDHAASVVALVHAHILADHVTRSIS